MTAPLFLLLHSSLSSAQQWRRLSAGLQARGQVLAADLMGYGRARAERPQQQPHRLATEAARLRRLLHEAGLAHRPMHLVGHSFGGAVALRLARELPGQVRSLALYEPVAFHLLPAIGPQRAAVQALAEQMRQDLAAGAAERAAEDFVDYWSDTGSFAAMAAATQARLALEVPKVLEDFAALLGEQCDATTYGRELGMPVLLLEGRHSRPAAREVVDELRAVLPAAEHALLPCGHMAPVAEPGRVNPLILDFLARQAR